MLRGVKERERKSSMESSRERIIVSESIFELLSLIITCQAFSCRLTDPIKI